MRALPAGTAERLALALIVVLPFLFYPADVHGHSIFLGLPLALGVSAVLLWQQRGWVRRGSHNPLLLAFLGLLAIATLAALLSSDPATSLSRALYLLAFGAFALGLAASLARRRLTPEHESDPGNDCLSLPSLRLQAGTVALWHRDGSDRRDATLRRSRSSKQPAESRTDEAEVT